MTRLASALPPLLALLALVAILAACAGVQGTLAPPPEQPAEEATTAPAAIVAGDPEAGRELFATTCAACHGKEGEGIEGLGKDMTTSEFIAGLSDEELLAFIKKGRPTDDPLNTTGVAMPPKGGNPGLDDAQLMDIIAYIRTLQK